MRLPMGQQTMYGTPVDAVATRSCQTERRQTIRESRAQREQEALDANTRQLEENQRRQREAAIQAEQIEAWKKEEAEVERTLQLLASTVASPSNTGDDQDDDGNDCSFKDEQEYDVDFDANPATMLNTSRTSTAYKPPKGSCHHNYPFWDHQTNLHDKLEKCGTHQIFRQLQGRT